MPFSINGAYLIAYESNRLPTEIAFTNLRLLITESNWWLQICIYDVLARPDSVLGLPNEWVVRCLLAYRSSRVASAVCHGRLCRGTFVLCGAVYTCSSLLSQSRTAETTVSRQRRFSVIFIRQRVREMNIGLNCVSQWLWKPACSSHVRACQTEQRYQCICCHHIGIEGGGREWRGSYPLSESLKGISPRNFLNISPRRFFSTFWNAFMASSFRWFSKLRDRIQGEIKILV